MWILRAFVVASLALLGALAYRSLPDLQRYLKMKRM